MNQHLGGPRETIELGLKNEHARGKSQASGRPALRCELEEALRQPRASRPSVAGLLHLLEKLRSARREGRGRNGCRRGLVPEAWLEAETRGRKREEELRLEEPVPVSTTLLASSGRQGGKAGKLGISAYRFARLELRGVGEGVLQTAED